MRILVASDTHGDQYAFQRAVEGQPKAKLVFHLGDGAREAREVARQFPDRQFLMVRGNNDWLTGTALPESGWRDAGGQRIFYTHGHRYYIKSGRERLVQAARSRQANIVLFGHTHIPEILYEEGMHFINPGSLGGRTPTFAVLDISDAGIAPYIVRLRV